MLLRKKRDIKKLGSVSVCFIVGVRPLVGEKTQGEKAVRLKNRGSAVRRETLGNTKLAMLKTARRDGEWTILCETISDAI